MITITVVGGTGTASANFGHLECEAVSLISPDNTPMYDFDIYNQDGAFVVGGSGITAQKAKIVEPFQLDGICSLQITNAVDDGVYSVSIFQR